MFEIFEKRKQKLRELSLEPRSGESNNQLSGNASSRGFSPRESVTTFQNKFIKDYDKIINIRQKENLETSEAVQYLKENTLRHTVTPTQLFT